MILSLKRAFIALSITMLIVLGYWNTPYAETKRPYYEAPADYREQINRLKAKFKDDYGYELLDLEEGWKSEDILKLDKIFAELPTTFYRLPGLNGFYRTGQLSRENIQIEPENIPAGVFPSYSTIYRQLGNTYNVYVDDEDPRLEFYNSLQYESPEDLVNIVQHEMGHAFDLTQGFLSFSAEWLRISGFRVIHIPALDGNKNSDYVYTLLNEAEKDVFAPVSTRHLPTYSRQNPQEDFANSVAAYIHYPYFRYSHPERYKYLKEKVFGGKEYFADSAISYDDKVLSDLELAVTKNNWDEVINIAVEVGRTYHPQLHAKITARLRQAFQAGVSGDSAVKLGLASCYFYDPDAHELRQDMVRAKKAASEVFIKNEQCSRMGREMFENVQVLWPVLSVFFYREDGKSILQLLDPALLTSQARGFDSIYLWRLYYPDSPKKPVAEGRMTATSGNGAVKIDLDKTSARKFVLPEGEMLELEVGVQRYHAKTFKTFNSPAEKMRFVYQPWFKYTADNLPTIKIVYPVRPAYHGK